MHSGAKAAAAAFLPLLLSGKRETKLASIGITSHDRDHSENRPQMPNSSGPQKRRLTEKRSFPQKYANEGGGRTKDSARRETDTKRPFPPTKSM